MTRVSGDPPRPPSRDLERGPAGPLRRVIRAWLVLAPDQRLAALSSLALFLTMFLPWYSKSAVGVHEGRPVKVQDDLNAFQAFSFVEAAVLLVAVSVLLLLFMRAERRAFHLPGGDGAVILAAGIWVCLLVFYRQLDKPDAAAIEGISTTVGVQWGIFLTFVAGVALAGAGHRVRRAHHVEPPLPGDETPTVIGPTGRPPARPGAGRSRPERAESASLGRPPSWVGPTETESRERPWFRE